MSEPMKSGLNHDAASRLVFLTPGELTALVRDGHVRRNGPNDYSLPVLVEDYLGYLRAQAERREQHPTQEELGELMDLSPRSVREFQAAAKIDHATASRAENLTAYIRHLREVAAGRATSEEGLDLATERAHLARAQRERVEMQNAVTRGELAPVSLLTEALANAAPKVCGLLESIVPALRRRSGYSADDLDYVAGVIAEARRAIASMRLHEQPGADADTETDEAALNAAMGEA